MRCTLASLSVLLVLATTAQAAPKLDPTSLTARETVPVRKVTQGPKYHWFGYYDKDQLDASGRYLLAMQVDFQDRSPRPEDVIRIGMIDLEDGDKWIELGESRAWCWQQGCMLQWRPGTTDEVLWNDREGDRFVTRIMNIKTKQQRTVPMAVYHVSPDGRWGITPDFRRTQYLRPGYGYAGLKDPNQDVAAPDNSGVWLVDLESGESKLIITLKQIVDIPYENPTPQDRHWFNHLQWSPDGERFIVFHRWSNGGSFSTRVFTANRDGSDIRLLSARDASHFQWRDPEHVLIWQQGAYQLFKDDGSGEPKETVLQAVNGHQSYVPGTNHEWLLTDTYPLGAKREQIVYLYHIPSGEARLLGKFPSPGNYKGEWRCDTHPRVTRDGKFAIIDSPHDGDGRQQYLVDLRPLLKR